MVNFRKAKKKVSKKKATKKSSKDTDWDFDGGAGFTTVDDDAPAPRRKRIHTQEKDEKLRRSRRKQHDQKLKNDFAKKMASKVRFAQVVAENSNEGDDDNDENSEIDIEESGPHLLKSSSLSKMDRLQRFLLKSLQRSSTSLNYQDINKKTKAPKRDLSHLPSLSDDEDSAKAKKGDATEAELAQRLTADFGMAFSAGKVNQLLTTTTLVKDIDITGNESGDESDSDEVTNQVVANASSKKGSKAPRKEVDYFSVFVDASSDPSSTSNYTTKAPKFQLTSRDIFHRHEYSMYISKPHDKTWAQFPAACLANIQSLPDVYKLWKAHPTEITFNRFQKMILPSLLMYQDAFLEGRDMHNNDTMIETTLMHSLFHVVKSRAKVVKHNQKLKQKLRDQKLQKAAEYAEMTANNSDKKNKKKRPASFVLPNLSSNGENIDEDVYRDQGFVRPRLLILCPFRHTARKIVDMMMTILGPNTSISGYDKFEIEYADPTDEDDPFAIYNEQDPKKQKKNAKRRNGPHGKPADWDAVFKGNVDDDFKMGIQVNPNHGKGAGATKGVYLRLYSDFYISDIILASPIALKLVMESNPNKLDYDFLSSIEQVIIHQADVLSYQNWEHVDYVLRHLNQLPKEQHDDTDFSRVRSYFLNGQGALHRQLMMTSAFNSPELQACFREFARSHCGQMRLKKDWELMSPLALRNHQRDDANGSTEGSGDALNKGSVQLKESQGGGDGAINDVFVSAKQVFQHIPLPPVQPVDDEDDKGQQPRASATPAGMSMVEDAEERRFLYFKDQVLAPILRLKQARTMIVTPSYLDFVRVRNYLIEQECNAAFLSEYSSESDIGRARSNFFQGTRDILLYSGRAHFFRRFKIRGARHVVFYSLPDYPHFYPEIVNMLAANYDDSIGLKKKAEEDEENHTSHSDKGLQLQEMSCLTMFTDFERMALERIVGSKKTQLMLDSEKNTFVFF